MFSFRLESPLINVHVFTPSQMDDQQKRKSFSPQLRSSIHPHSFITKLVWLVENPPNKHRTASRLRKARKLPKVNLYQFSQGRIYFDGNVIIVLSSFHLLLIPSFCLQSCKEVTSAMLKALPLVRGKLWTYGSSNLKRYWSQGMSRRLVFKLYWISFIEKHFPSFYGRRKNFVLRDFDQSF